MQYRWFTRLWSSKDAEAKCGYFTDLRFLYLFNSHFLLHLKTYQLIPPSQLIVLLDWKFWRVLLCFVTTVICDCCISTPSEAGMSEVVIVTIPESVDDLPSVEEQTKAVLVAAELTPQAG